MLSSRNGDYDFGIFCMVVTALLAVSLMIRDLRHGFEETAERLTAIESKLAALESCE